MPSTRNTTKPTKTRTADTFLTVDQIAESWQLGTQFVRREIASGALPAVRFGRAVRVRLADVQEYWAKRVSGPSQ